MEPGVPFSLMGAVQLLAVAACAGLAVAALLRRSLPAALIALGAVVLAGVQVRTALQLGTPSSDDLMLARAAGALLVGAGFATGGLGSRLVPTSLYGVVVPLAAGGSEASFAAGAMAFAAGAIVWNRRDVVGLWLGAGFGLWAVSAALATWADEGSSVPVTLLVLRGVGAVCLLVALGLLAQASLLSKVVGAIIVGVLAMAIAAVAVVGNVVVASYDKQSREGVEAAASSRVTALTSLGEENRNRARLVARTTDCAGFLRELLPNAGSDFVVRVPAKGQAESVCGRPPLNKTELLRLAQDGTVRAVLRGSGPNLLKLGLAGKSRILSQPKPTLAVIGVAPGRSGSTGQAAPQEVYVYGIRLDQEYVNRDLDAGGFNLTLLTGDPLVVVSTNKSDREAAQVLSIARAAGADKRIPEGGLTIGSQGSAPTLRVVELKAADGSRAGLLVLSRDAGPALKTQRDALRLLMETALLALVLVAAGAAVLGRRTVEPVRQLTLAAERVAGGDLSATASVGTRDEVGTLSRAFDDMTSSLGQLTGDLRESAARLETVLSSMSDGLLATDELGLVTSVNRAALEMLGLDVEDVLGEPLPVVADVRDAAGNQLANTGLRLRDEVAEVHRPDGSTVPVRVEISGLLEAEGVVLVLRDTTREREIERMKTEFLSNVSHELRTPLTPIHGYAEMLVARPGLDASRVTEFATEIRDASLKMNRVVELLVDVATFETGKQSVTPRPVTVKSLLDARVEIWQARAPKRAKDLKRRVATGLPPVWVDPVWVAKALDEFIDNAVKYTATGTPITLSGTLSPDGTRVRVAVKDAGPGISEADQVALFTSFEQVDGSATRRVGGLGLGLSFVRRLAEDAGFPLTVTTRVGRGAEFALDLPIADVPAARSPARKGARARKR